MCGRLSRLQYYANFFAINISLFFQISILLLRTSVPRGAPGAERYPGPSGRASTGVCCCRVAIGGSRSYNVHRFPLHLNFAEYCFCSTHLLVIYENLIISGYDRSFSIIGQMAVKNSRTCLIVYAPIGYSIIIS